MLKRKFRVLPRHYKYACIVTEKPYLKDIPPLLVTSKAVLNKIIISYEVPFGISCKDNIYENKASTRLTSLLPKHLRPEVYLGFVVFLDRGIFVHT